MQFLSDYFGGHDFGDATLDARAVDLGLHKSTTVRADIRRFRTLVAQQNPMLRALYSMLTGSMDLSECIGTPQQVADSLERWVEAGAADGFILMAPSPPDGLEDFIAQVVPLLQALGHVRAAYEGHSLREHLASSARACRCGNAVTGRGPVRHAHRAPTGCAWPGPPAS